jgi:hypothetical protein
VFAREGIRAAMAQFVRLAGLDFSDRESDVELTPSSPTRIPNLEFFLTFDAPAVRQYRPDTDALREFADKIIPAVGVNSTGPVPRCATALAETLQRTVVSMPGGHNAPTVRPRAFAERLQELLTDPSLSSKA